MERDYEAELAMLLPLMDDDLKVELLELLREVRDQGLQGTKPRKTA